MTPDDPEVPTFTCTMCGQTYRKAWSDADALAESKALFGDVPCAVVCDDCYRGVLPSAPEDYPRIIADQRRELDLARARVNVLEAAAMVVLQEMGRVGGADSQRLNTALRIMRVGPDNVHWCAVCQHGQREHMHLDGSCAVWQCACAGFQPVKLS